MQKRVIGYVNALMLLSFSLSFAAQAQTKDSSITIASTDQQQNVNPVILSGKTFYDAFNPDRKGLRPIVLYSSDDRFFVGLNYNTTSSQYTPDSAGSKHQLYTHYSITQKAFNIGYQGIVHRFAGHWNLFVDAGYDWVKWINFSGVGNESEVPEGDRDYYRIRSSILSINTAFQHRIGKQSSIIITPFFQRIKLLKDEDRFLSKTSFNQDVSKNYEANYFGGLRGDLLLQRLDDQLLPTKGVIFSTGVAHVRNTNGGSAFTNYNAYSRFYLPFLRHFVLSIENGGATVIGEPEFYQLNSIGGSSLRGYRRDRFWGETVFHNNNELQYLFDAPAKFFSGKLGLLAFVDQGRVWKEGEQSDKWHYGYGGGLIIVPYRKVFLSLQYGVSSERSGFHFTVRRPL